MGALSVADLSDLLRDVPDFPEPGIVFKDITPLLADPDALASTIDHLVEPWRSVDVDLVAGIEARGFLLGPAVARALGVGFVPIRKAGKLPAAVVAKDYALEYGSDTIEVHADAVAAGDHVLVLDDVLATGGTAAAAASLIDDVGGRIAGFSFLIELGFLDGRARLDGAPVNSLIQVRA